MVSPGLWSKPQTGWKRNKCVKKIKIRLRRGEEGIWKVKSETRFEELDLRIRGNKGHAIRKMGKRKVQREKKFAKND